MSDETKPVKENFCGACLSVPIAFAGAGFTAYGSMSTKDKHKKQRKIYLWTGIASICLSILIYLYFAKIKKCKECESR